MSMYGRKTNLPSKFQVQILMTKIKEYFNLQKDRKSNDVVKEEKLLMKLLSSPGRSKLQESLTMEKIVNILRYINALRFLISYAEAVKSQSVIIAEPLKYQDRLYELMPYVMGIIYAAKPTGLTCISQFRAMMQQIFGRQNLELSYNEGNFIPVQLRKCFQPMQPTFKEINQYALEMCQRNDYSLEVLNSVGHNFSPYAGNLGPQMSGGQQKPSNGGNYGKNDGHGNPGGQGNHGKPNPGNNGGYSGGYDYNNPPWSKDNTTNGYGGSYIPTYSPPPLNQPQKFSPNSFLPIYQPTDFDSKHPQGSQNQEFRFPVTTSTIVGPSNLSTFH